MAEPSPGEIDRVEAATRVFEGVVGGIPAPVLANAKGIAIIPSELKAGFIFGGELGRGVLVTRDPKGSWSPPAFIPVAGGSFGLQIGGEARDIVLVFNTARSVDLIENWRLKLGGDASVTAGPVGGDFAVTSDIPEVYSYVRSFGAFIGATVEGSVLSFDLDANRDFYGVSDPLKARAAAIPEPARRLGCSVARATGAPSEVCG
jgi:lipid-binding SYLF domain-containing protein